MNIYDNLKGSNEPSSLELIAHLRASIVNNLVPFITSTQSDKILTLVDNFKGSILSYHDGINLLEAYKDGYRKALIADIINSKFTQILQECSSINSLSEILFGDRNELPHKFFYSNSISIYGRPELYTLWHIRLRVSTWTANDFKSEGHIDQNTLDSLIKEVTGKIDKFISYESLNGYRKAFDINFNEDFNYMVFDYYKPGYEGELEVIRAFHRAFTAFTGDPKLSFRTIKIATKIVLQQASGGHRFSIDTFRKLVSVLENFAKKDINTISQNNPKYEFMNRLTLNQRQKIYEVALDTIRKYMCDSGTDRQKNWEDENVKAYHIVNGLKRNVGMDFLSFTTLDKNIFIKIKNKIANFARHHFRNDFFKKLSNYIQDQILTSAAKHNQYRSYSEDEILVILNGFDKMMEMRGSGIDGAITRNDVINIFRGNDWVLNGYDGKGGKNGETGWFFSKAGFDNMLAEFNVRKDLLQNEGLEQFLANKYDTVYERFYLNLPHGSISDLDIVVRADGFYSLVFPQPSLRDINIAMNLDSGLFYPEY